MPIISPRCVPEHLKRPYHLVPFCEHVHDLLAPVGESPAKCSEPLLRLRSQLRGEKLVRDIHVPRADRLQQAAQHGLISLLPTRSVLLPRFPRRAKLSPTDMMPPSGLRHIGCRFIHPVADKVCSRKLAASGVCGVLGNSEASLLKCPSTLSAGLQ